ncbi:MAG: hypothetical protein GXO15_05415 [Crenarchaeota archaeon]|nr:hypothetical protein [Thermoproteota archaeon]
MDPEAVLAVMAYLAAVLASLSSPAPHHPWAGHAGGLACYCLTDVAGALDEILSYPWRVAVVEASEAPPGLPRMLHGRGAGLVLGYVNAGYAEEWRSYMERLRGAGVVHEPAGYEGEYLVELWSREWLEAVLSEARRVIEAGYDGVYLDNIDAYLAVEGRPWAAGADPQAAMVELVCTVSEEVRTLKPGARVYINIGSAVELLYNDTLLSCIDGVLREELWSTAAGDTVEPQDPWETLEALDALWQAASRGKTVIVSDPVAGPEDARRLCSRAWSRGWLPVPQPIDAWDYSRPPPVGWCTRRSS